MPVLLRHHPIELPFGHDFFELSEDAIVHGAYQVSAGTPPSQPPVPGPRRGLPDRDAPGWFRPV